MANIIKCYKVRADISQIKSLNTFVEKVIKIGNLVFDNDGNVAVWLNDDKDKKDLIRVLKSNGITEYFCEPITYESIGKDRAYNFLSAWFMENYNAFLVREAENRNQQQLCKMYNDVQRAQTELDIIIKTGVSKTSMTNQNFEKEARDV